MLLIVFESREHHDIIVSLGWLPGCLAALLAACLPVCLSACLPACLSACLPVCCLHACLPAWLPGCRPACLPALPACLLCLHACLLCLHACLQEHVPHACWLVAWGRAWLNSFCLALFVVSNSFVAIFLYLCLGHFTKSFRLFFDIICYLLFVICCMSCNLSLPGTSL